MGNTFGKLKKTKENDEERQAKTELEEKKYQCIKCVKVVSVTSSDGIEAGDHVVLRKPMYDHHLIIISKCHERNNFEVAEATNSFLGAVFGKSVSSPSKGKSRVSLTMKTFDFEKDNIGVVMYEKRLPKTETVELALYLQEAIHKEFKYQLLNYNCEHFATYCVTGEKFSGQVIKVKATISLFLNSRFDGISDERLRNEELSSRGLLCKECFERSKDDLDVNVVEIRSENDIQTGDIIQYKYWRLWHDAIVLDKIEATERTVVLSIAHYAFCGIASYRTIRKEVVTFRLNGSCRKLEYTCPKFRVNPPGRVVERAERRIGEQLFVFFSNDSSHFARWCKLGTSLETLNSFKKT